MTLAALKEVLQDRVNLLTEEFSAHIRSSLPWEHRWEAGYLEGRLEEVRVCLRLVEKLQLDEKHPLVANEAEPGVDRHDPGRC